jgi:hypothetical protein
MIEDLGSLSDYVLNGDNYEQVQPDGSVLEIPTNYPTPTPQIVVPICISGFRTSCDPFGPADTWLTLDPTCTIDNSPYCVAHDRTTDLYFIAFNCNGIPGGLETLDDCNADCAAYLASIDGGPLDAAFPGWLIEILYPTALFNELPTLDIDFWFVACPGGSIVIQNFPTPQVATCPAPFVNRTAQGCPTGYAVVPNLPECCQQVCCVSYSPYGAGCCVTSGPAGPQGS